MNWRLMRRSTAHYLYPGAISCFSGGESIPEGFRVEWRERGGPTVKAAERKGFGRFVIDQMVTRSLHATVGIDLPPEGFRWTLDMPASQVQRAMPGKPG